MAEILDPNTRELIILKFGHIPEFYTDWARKGQTVKLEEFNFQDGYARFSVFWNTEESRELYRTIDYVLVNDAPRLVARRQKEDLDREKFNVSYIHEDRQITTYAESLLDSSEITLSEIVGKGFSSIQLARGVFLDNKLWLLSLCYKGIQNHSFLTMRSQRYFEDLFLHGTLSSSPFYLPGIVFINEGDTINAELENISKSSPILKIGTVEPKTIIAPPETKPYVFTVFREPESFKVQIRNSNDNWVANPSIPSSLDSLTFGQMLRGERSDWITVSQTLPTTLGI